MISCTELELYLSDFLNCAEYANDYAPNGLQVAGRNTIQSICTAVTASKSIILQAANCGADALLVHHGYFWRSESPALVSMKGRRIAALMQNNMNLFAYHLPLDCHAQIGNNACIAQSLHINNLTQHPAFNTPNLLWMGEFKHERSLDSVSLQLEQIFSRKPLILEGGKHLVKKISFCSGGAQDLIEQASFIGADLYLSGEVSERTFYQAEELGIHYAACGHHATESFGIQTLGEYLAQQFGLKHTFLDSQNPI